MRDYVTSHERITPPARSFWWLDLIFLVGLFGFVFFCLLLVTN